jgi:putative chitinase
MLKIFINKIFIMLKLGSNGNGVKDLQVKLGLTPDGDFGPITEKKLKEWQSKNGLTPDGIAGPMTLTKLGLVESVSIPKNDKINLSNLVGHIPDSVIKQLPDVIEKFGATTNLRLAHFLSQCSHESGNFKLVNENLNYGEDGLLKTFRSDFDMNKNRIFEANERLKAKTLSRNPQAIANFVYANQNGNGNEASGDGWKYRGAGYIQLTGRANFKRFSDFIGEDCVAKPELVATKYPLASAAFFFNVNNLWVICDRGTTDEVVTSVTKRINGGSNGLSDRIEKFKKFYNILK